ncbi:hypothetical protein BGLT_00643 [Caballeronia glathei]|jgi:hypothetical protein|uniref:Uncharacterized protein n=1 Tax=Caballeronia glathei TaxID=60547 RepID=A0A069PVZ1_9BURK|nr:hypothetical protein [Caballeronia glathei]KDR44004.1 hypothetical protein BG61_25025 [Caballeronia glathei]CDY74356.1 hypothetical protein BGLT_00643 [Caballeronia glathei]
MNTANRGSGAGRSDASPRRAARWRRAVLVAILLVAYAAADIFWPLKRDASRFDPVAMGTLEAGMWRSYYDHQPLALFSDLAQTLRTQYGFPFLRSYVGAYFAASAAFTFKDGKSRSDYERALPELRTYFRMIRNTVAPKFDADRAATLELAWWVVHREHERHSADTLARACAEAASAVYLVPVEATLAHGRLRAHAMLIRDARAEHDAMSESEWGHIELLLQQSYRSLCVAVSRDAARSELCGANADASPASPAP